MNSKLCLNCGEKTEGFQYCSEECKRELFRKEQHRKEIMNSFQGWSAMYMPGDREWAKHGFTSPDKTYDYILDNCLCPECKKELELSKTNPDYDPDLPCTAEYLVLKTSEYFEKEDGSIDWEMMDREVEE